MCNDISLLSNGNRSCRSCGISYKDKPLAHAWSGILGFLACKLFLQCMHMYSTSVESRTELYWYDRHIFTIEFVIEKSSAWKETTDLQNSR